MFPLYFPVRLSQTRWRRTGRRRAAAAAITFFERQMMFKRIALAALFAVFAFGLSQAADFSKIPNPMNNAKKGQWVTYTAMAGMEQKQSITEIEGTGDDRVVVIKTEVLMEGMPAQATETKVNLKDARAAQEAAWSVNPDVKISDATVEAGGKTYKTVLVEVGAQGVTTKMYMSEDIPVTGIVKMESSALPGPLMVVKDYSK